MGYRGIMGPRGIVAMGQYGNATEVHEPSSPSMNFSMVWHVSAMVYHEGPWYCHGTAMKFHASVMASHEGPWHDMTGHGSVMACRELLHDLP